MRLQPYQDYRGVGRGIGVGLNLAGGIGLTVGCTLRNTPPPAVPAKTNPSESIVTVQTFPPDINSNGGIFAGTFEGGGVYRSTDDGDNWTLVDNGLTNTYVTALAINSGGDVFAATFGGGAQWETFNTFLGF
jgi:hypothetical protein